MVGNLVRIPIFAELAHADLEELERGADRQSFQSGEVIFSQGDVGDTLYLIESGTVKITMTHDSGQQLALVLLHPGEFFGELSLFDGQPRSATATAIEATVTLNVRKERLLRFVEERPRASFAFLKVLSQRLRRTDELVADASFLDIAGRMAKNLVELADSLGEEGPSGVVVRLRRVYGEVAEIAGLDLDTTRRWLTRFEHRGLIKVERNNLVFLRLEDMRQGALGPDVALGSVPWAL